MNVDQLFNLAEVHAKVTNEYLQERGIFTPRYEPCSWCRKPVWITVRPHILGVVCSEDCIRLSDEHYREEPIEKQEDE